MCFSSILKNHILKRFKRSIGKMYRFNILIIRIETLDLILTDIRQYWICWFRGISGKGT